LSEENGRKKLWEAWVENPPPPHHPLSRLRLASLARISHRPGNVVQRVPFKGEKATHGACVRASTKKIELVEVQLQRDLTNVEVRGILSDAQGKLADFFQNSMERNQHLFTSKWLRYRDTCSKAFFDFHRIGKKKTLLCELETKEGIVSSQSDLALYVTSFYANLYSSDAPTPGMAEAQTVCWKSVPPRSRKL